MGNTYDQRAPPLAKGRSGGVENQHGYKLLRVGE